MTEEPEHGDRLRALRLPNNELRQALRLVIVEWFECAAEDIRDVDAFRDGLCRGNEDTVRRALSRILGDAGIGETDPDKPLPYHLLLQGLCFGLPGYANPASRRKCGAGRWDIQVFPTGAVFDVADTIGMLDERPLITINLMYDPDVDASTKSVCRAPAWVACAGGSVLMGSMWLRCASCFKRRGVSGFRYSVSFMGGMGFQLGSLTILRASFMPRRSAGMPVLKHLSTAARRMNSLQKVAALPRRNSTG